MIEAFLCDALGRPPEGLRILDIGCGNGDICAHFAERNAVIGVDLRDQFRPEHRHIPHCLALSEALPFPAGSFDVVYRPINNETCIILSHAYHMTRSQPCDRPNCILPTRIAS